MAMELTGADYVAVSRADGDYFNEKGANCYLQEDYQRAIEYYRLGAILGNVDSLSNLGYCYMYGHGTNRQGSLALAYFELASRDGSIDAIYKLGDIYRRGACGVTVDPERASYYFHWAEGIIGDSPRQLRRYPSLCKALAIEKMPGGYLPTDLEDAFEYLKLAKEGYEQEIQYGAHYYEKSLQEVETLLTSFVFNELRGVDSDESELYNYDIRDLVDLDDDILPGTNYGLSYKDDDEEDADAEDDLEDLDTDDIDDSGEDE